jgi:hypothetical protein
MLTQQGHPPPVWGPCRTQSILALLHPMVRAGPANGALSSNDPFRIKPDWLIAHGFVPQFGRVSMYAGVFVTLVTFVPSGRATKRSAGGP